MPYKLFIGHASNTSFKDLKEMLEETQRDRLSVIGGQTEIKEMIDPSRYPMALQQEWEDFTGTAIRFYLLELNSSKQLQATWQKLEESDLPLIFFLGTHGSGDTP